MDLSEKPSDGHVTVVKSGTTTPLVSPADYTFNATTNVLTLSESLRGSVSTIQVTYTGLPAKQYYGDEAVQDGQPLVDSQGKLLRTDTGVLITYTDDPNDPGLTADTVTKVFYQDSKGNPIYHRRRESIYNNDGSRQFYSGGDVQRYFGDEPRLFFGGEIASTQRRSSASAAALLSLVQDLGEWPGRLREYRSLGDQPGQSE